MFQFYITVQVVFCSLIGINSSFFHSQTLTNKGAFIQSMPGSFIRVNGSFQNDNSGLITVNGNGTATSAQVYVTEDITNNATITADGYIKLLRHWYNNNSFNYGLSTVFLEGGNQFLGGTVATTFNNLTLDGTGIKTQQINKSSAGILALNNLHLNTDIYTFFVQNTSTTAITRDISTITAGFVSSANGGYLSRVTNSTGTYLFPVGSTANNSANTPGTGTTRYRPVEIIPNSNASSTYTARMANLDASTTTENLGSGYNRSLKENTICTTNPSFFHQINRTSGTADTDIKIYYIAADDGAWQGLARWNLPTNDNTWRVIAGSSTATAINPFSVATKTAWNNFSANPYILYNGLSVIANCGGPVCSNVSSPIHSLSSTTTPPIGTYTYSWTSNPVGFTSSSANPTLSPTPSTTTTYTVIVNNTVDNCQATNNCTLSVNQNPSLIFLSPP
jgi:hypothetical protein